MSYLTESPDLMLEVLAVLVRRAGGAVKISLDEAPGPFNLMSSWEGNQLRLVLDETVTPQDVERLQSGGVQ